MSLLRDRFLKYIPAHGTILDAGCGPGRDVKEFKEQGFDICSMDASESIVEHC